MGAQATAGTRQCVILGAGEILDYEKARSLIELDAFVICADGGYRHCALLETCPDLLVGDFDSYLGENISPELEKVTLRPDKDYTDSTLSIEEARSRGFERVLLLGMLGGRLDHTIANLQDLCDCVQRGMDARITDGITWVYALAAEGSPAHIDLECRPGHYFSLFSFSEQSHGVTIQGAAYPLSGYTLRNCVPRAVSNEFVDGPVRVSLRQGTLLIMVLPIDKK